jgi:histidine triad (HIT) family protein
MATIFSRIVAGEIPCYKVAENDRFFAFLDIAPLAKYHTLVIPKREVDYFYDLEDDELQEMMVFAKQIAKKIKATTSCTKVATVVLGLEVPHAHIHLIPIENENDVDFHREKLKFTPDEFKNTAKKIGF